MFNLREARHRDFDRAYHFLARNRTIVDLGGDFDPIDFIETSTGLYKKYAQKSLNLCLQNISDIPVILL